MRASTATDQQTAVNLLRDLLRTEATRLGLDPASITSPAPNAITATAPDGSLLRLDVSRYQPVELSI